MDKQFPMHLLAHMSVFRLFKTMRLLGAFKRRLQEALFGFFITKAFAGHGRS